MARVAFKQCDLVRALRAGKQAGVAVAVHISPKTGDMIVRPVDASEPAPEASEPDFWESYNADQGRA